MLHRYLFLFSVLFASLQASDYPQTFFNMGASLFKASEAIGKLSDIDELESISDEYVKYANRTMKSGFIVDESNLNSQKKSYLLELRGLQKRYNRFLHLLHKNIELSIDKKNYDRFYRLTSYEFDGLLKGRSLLKRSIDFYKERRHKKRSKFLDSKIDYKRLLKATQSEFYLEIKKATYNSSLNRDNSKKSVYIFSKESKEYITIFARNKKPHSITMNIKAKTKHLKYMSVKESFSMEANSTKEYLKLYKQKDDYSYRFSYSWIKGSMNAVHNDSYIYRLPYAISSSHVVSQGFNTNMTHKGKNAYAIDFAMNIGTKIYASRGGVVVGIKEDSSRGGYSREFARDGNFVTIEHKDATLATYYHLNKNGVVVKIGEGVKRGELLAYSGNTGYSSGPHLHFQVYKAVDAKTTQSIPIKFMSERGVIRDPKRGVYYRAK